MGFIALVVHAIIIARIVSPDWHIFYNVAALMSLVVFHILTLGILWTIEAHDRTVFLKTVLQRQTAS